MKKHIYLLLLVSIIPLQLWAQDDLLSSLETEQPKTRQLVYASFKGTRLINLHTVETLGKGSLDFRISHRFSDFSSGMGNLWGLDGAATIRLGFDYSVTDRFTCGIGRSSYGKMVDGFLKYKLLRQTADNSIPISVSGLLTLNIASGEDPNKVVLGADRYEKFSSRIAYLYQLLIARKFNERLTLQLSPSFIHYNMVIQLHDKNDILALGLSGRYKITRSIALTGEYIFRINQYTSDQSVAYHNSASIGLDLETGGHVFQLFVTNSFAINEVQLIPYTTSQWDKGQIRLGFNVSRVFSIAKNRKSLN
jgi:hypothetical protein